MSTNNSSNGSENFEGYIREEPRESLEDVHYNGHASGDENMEDQVEHSRLQDGHQPNSQSVSDDEEDMVKLDNNDLNYDDYDDYEGEARERVESNNSSMIGVSDSEGEEADDVQKADQKCEKRMAVNNDFEENEAGDLPEDDDGIEKQKEIKNKKEVEELEEGELEDEDDEEEIEEKSSSPPLMVSSSQSSICLPSLVSSLNAAQPIELPLPIVEPIQTFKPREVCRFYLRGICKNGEACRFKHCTQSVVQVF
ncbi:unnamed protein product [Meloidogyne enterolobii]|uniref:Uncharacterized protein n=1 Tax=Meloidogyne enterolobii TaxID=390850 RepID=A0ACB0ZNE6_MELEN